MSQTLQEFKIFILIAHGVSTKEITLTLGPPPSSDKRARHRPVSVLGLPNGERVRDSHDVRCGSCGHGERGWTNGVEEGDKVEQRGGAGLHAAAKLFSEVLRDTWFPWNRTFSAFKEH